MNFYSGRVNVGFGVQYSAVGNYVRPGSCLLPAPALSPAVAPGFLMTIHIMDTRGRKSSNSSNGTDFSLGVMA